MARVTVEDCLKNVKNRFELVIIAAKRARQLMRGREPKVAWDNDKSTVVALREIAAGFTDFDHQEPAVEETSFNLQVTTIVEEEVIDIENGNEIQPKLEIQEEIIEEIEVPNIVFNETPEVKDLDLTPTEIKDATVPETEGLASTEVEDRTEDEDTESSENASNQD